MAKARDIKRRMRSVDNTKKITRTMEMVAASKLRRAQQRVEASRPYSRKLTAAIERLADPELAEMQPLLRQPEEERRAAVLLLTSDRGLCGAFNSNLTRKARELLDELEEREVETRFHVAGQKGISYFRFRDVPMERTVTDVGDRPGVGEARDLVGDLARDFAEERLDALYVVYARFESIMTTPPTRRRVLPVPLSGGESGGPWYILDPSAEEILEELLPLYVVNSVFQALVESAAAEQGARRTAMKNATDNAEEMMDELRRSYNRARQAEITQQIAEIMGGAEALAEE
jgi:F-type H+-transporting ATPase subunit gamma